MKTIKIFSLLIAAAAGFSACENDNDDVTQTTQQQLQNSWAVDSVSVKSFTDSLDTSITYVGTAADYYDFRNDNNLYVKIGPVTDTLPYSLINDQTINIDGDSAQIETLSANKLQAFWRNTNSATDYTETRAYLHR
jgi:hypothetical protein